MLPPLDVIQAVIGGGIAGVMGVGIWWLASGRGRVGSLVDKREKELIDERDAWKTLAQTIGPEIKRLNDLLDTAVKLLLDPRRSDADIEHIESELVRAIKAELAKR